MFLQRGMEGTNRHEYGNGERREDNKTLKWGLISVYPVHLHMSPPNKQPEASWFNFGSAVGELLFSLNGSTIGSHSVHAALAAGYLHGQQSSHFLTSCLPWSCERHRTQQAEACRLFWWEYPVQLHQEGCTAVCFKKCRPRSKEPQRGPQACELDPTNFSIDEQGRRGSPLTTKKAILGIMGLAWIKTTWDVGLYKEWN